VEAEVEAAAGAAAAGCSPRVTGTE
jgi:hypothetical protein